MTAARERVVVTGIGLVTPLGTGTDAVWEAMLAGRSGVGEIRSFDPSKLAVRIAAEVDDFDAADWLRHRDRHHTDRFTHFAAAAAAQALAGARLGDRDGTATVIGSAIGGARTILDGVHTDATRPELISPFFVPASIVNMAAGTIARLHGLGGPSGAPVTACASGADAIGQAFRLVRDGYAAAAVAGGSEACIVSPLIAGFGAMRALSRRNDTPTEASRPFDADRDGFVMGEGAGLLLLETLTAARARDADILAELVGFGQTNDAYNATRPRPDGGQAARAMRLALADGGVDPAEVGYVNAHGTSTPLSDVSETLAIKAVLGDRVPVSSTKSMTGHLLGASGGVEAAACVLALRHGWLPPTVNQVSADPECDLDYVPNEARKADIDVAISNSFAFGGHNTSLVLRRYAP